MRARIKHTFYIGEVTNIAGSSDNPTVELTMANGSQLCYPQDQLTSKPPLLFMWSLLDKIKLRLTP